MRFGATGYMGRLLVSFWAADELADADRAFKVTCG